MYKEFAAQLLEDEQYDDMTMRDELMAAASEPVVTEPETAALLTDDEVLLPHYECFRF